MNTSLVSINGKKEERDALWVCLNDATVLRYIGLARSECASMWI